MRYVLSVILLAAAAPVAAEPYLSVRTGLKCSQCHTNVTGGGNRTAFGAIFAQTQLPMRPGGTVVGKGLTDFLSVGFDVRFQVSGTLSESVSTGGVVSSASPASFSSSNVSLSESRS